MFGVEMSRSDHGSLHPCAAGGLRFPPHRPGAVQEVYLAAVHNTIIINTVANTAHLEAVKILVPP